MLSSVVPIRMPKVVLNNLSLPSAKRPICSNEIVLIWLAALHAVAVLISEWLLGTTRLHHIKGRSLGLLASAQKLRDDLPKLLVMANHVL